MEYKIKGIILNAADLALINDYYERACTAEYIEENYKVNPKESFKLASIIRKRMDKYNDAEDEAAYEVCKLYGYIV